MKASLLLIGLLSAGVALAGPPAPKRKGIEGKDYKWNAEGGEKMRGPEAEGRREARRGGL